MSNRVVGEPISPETLPSGIYEIFVGSGNLQMLSVINGVLAISHNYDERTHKFYLEYVPQKESYLIVHAHTCQSLYSVGRAIAIKNQTKDDSQFFAISQKNNNKACTIRSLESKNKRIWGCQDFQSYQGNPIISRQPNNIGIQKFAFKSASRWIGQHNPVFRLHVSLNHSFKITTQYEKQLKAKQIAKQALEYSKNYSIPKEFAFFIILGSVQTSETSLIKKKKSIQKQIDGLDGLKLDAAHIYSYLRTNGNQYLGQYQIGLSKKDSKQRLFEQLFQQFQGHQKILIYYSGHGCENGDWSSYSYSITPQDIYDATVMLGKQLILIIDSCHSGNWEVMKGHCLKVITSCGKNESCYDWGFKYGSAFTYQFTHTHDYSYQRLGSTPEFY